MAALKYYSPSFILRNGIRNVYNNISGRSIEDMTSMQAPYSVDEIRDKIQPEKFDNPY